MPCKILHLDLDAFFCAVEEQRDPSLRGTIGVVSAFPASIAIEWRVMVVQPARQPLGTKESVKQKSRVA